MFNTFIELIKCNVFKTNEINDIYKLLIYQKIHYIQILQIIRYYLTTYNHILLIFRINRYLFLIYYFK